MLHRSTPICKKSHRYTQRIILNLKSIFNYSMFKFLPAGRQVQTKKYPPFFKGGWPDGHRTGWVFLSKRDFNFCPQTFGKFFEQGKRRIGLHGFNPGNNCLGGFGLFGQFSLGHFSGKSFFNQLFGQLVFHFSFFPGFFKLRIFESLLQVFFESIGKFVSHTQDDISKDIICQDSDNTGLGPFRFLF
jgi:hypothetical protein